MQPYLASLKMSASLLNDFVNYKNTCDGGLVGFVTKSLLRLPTKPSEALEFGSLVHSFMEDWLNHVVKAGDQSPEQLLADYREKIAWLDFEQVAREQMRQRFDAIYEQFMPQADALLIPSAQAEQWANAMLGEIPLTGKFDLFIANEETRQITIYDFKTGKADAQSTPTAEQWRQLRFYKLLLESSPKFQGWEVSAAADLYVDPTQVVGGNISLPEPIDLKRADLSDLKLLIQAVWWRIQRQDFDCSGFETSVQMQQLREGSQYKGAGKGHEAGDQKEPNAADKQKAFELWLIEDFSRRR
jgi:hypothetical protein